MTNDIYQVFVAKSLKLTEHREAVKTVIEESNVELQQEGISFEVFLYDCSPNFNQKIEKRDAQAPADRALRQSTIFILIIDDVIRDLTRYEFEAALENYERGELPQYIFIFYNEQTAQNSCEGGMSYMDFLKYENLECYMADRRNNIIGHRRVYSIPFSDMEDLKKGVADELNAFAKSDDRPFPGAIRGYMLTKEHFFFSDVRRMEKCTDLYLRRKVDDELDEALRNRRVIVVSGASLSGKTRAVMEALKGMNDGWVYIPQEAHVQQDIQTQFFVAEIDRLLLYAKKAEAPKLYVFFDNLDQLIKIEAIRNALKLFLSQIVNSNIVFVATSSAGDINLPGTNPRENPRAAWLDIKEMEDREFSDVKKFFLSAGVPLDERNMRYRRTGALFVDLNSILDDYKTWLNKGNELMKLAKRMILKAIKGLSMWRDDSLGDRHQMLQLASWFCQRDIDCEWEPYEIEEACRRALQSLVEGGRMGISSISKDAPLTIQEYIYCYFIGRDGMLLSSEDCFSEEDEKDMARQILLYCITNAHEEALTVQASRICRRCTYKSSTTRWLYYLWIGGEDASGRDEKLSRMLQDDRRQCENGALSNIHFYSNLIERHIYCGCLDYAEAQKAYDACPVTLRTGHLLSALMRKAQPEEVRNLIKEMDDYQRMKDDAYVISVEVEWARDYQHALHAFSRFSLSEDAIEIATQLLETEKPYDVFQLRKAVGALALKVSDIEEFLDFCELLRKLYPYLVSDTRVLEEIRGRRLAFRANELTLIDLLSVLSSYAQSQLVNHVFGGDLDASQDFVAELASCVDSTIRRPYTDETTIRMTVSYTTSQLIRSLSDAPYEEVYDGLFAPLKIRHPKRPDKWLILRNSYSYTAMLDNAYCGVLQAGNLMENDLIPHARDVANNPLNINTYTLNKMIDKSKDEKKRMYADIINILYDQLHKQRDAFTYSRLIAIATNLYECFEWLKQMSAQGIRPNVFVVGELMGRPEINLATALSFLDLSGISLPNGYEPLIFEWKQGHDNFIFDPNAIVEQMRPALSKVNIGWSHLFEKACQSSMDRDTLSACLTYLETKQQQLLRDGYIYNSIIKNTTYLQTFEEVINFINKSIKGDLFRIDPYTISHLIDRIADMKGFKERVWAVCQLNELLMQADEKVRKNSVNISKRLKIFKDHIESLKMVFFDDKGNADIRQVSATGYVELMCKYHYPVDSFTIANLLGIRRNLSNNTYRRLMKVLVKQQEFYTLNPNDIRIIREKCKDFYEDYVDKISALQAPLPIPAYNKNIGWKYWRKEIIINEALGLLDWSNYNSALSAFNSILNNFIDFQKNERMGVGLFDVVMQYYRIFLKDYNRAPSSLTFSILSKATSRWEDLQVLLNEFDIQKQKYPRLTLQPQIYAHMSAQVRSVKELTERTNMLQNKGCAYSTKGADIYVFRLSRYLRASDTERAEAILDDLLHYLIEGGDTDLLLKNEREYLMLGLYSEPSNVSHNVLRTMIYYNQSRTIEKRYETKAIVDCIANKYYDSIIPLMNELLKDIQSKHSPLPISGPEVYRIKSQIARTYLLRLFFCIHDDSRPHLSSQLLSYMVSILPNVEEYNNFMRKLYTIDCQDIDKMVLAAAKFLKRMTREKRIPDVQLQAVRKTLAQIFVYADICLIRNGNLLVEKAPERYATWCRCPMDSTHIREELRTLYQYSLSEKIKYFTDCLDDAYPCSLMTIYLRSNMEEVINEETMTIIKKQELKYAQMMKSELVSFRDVTRLPLMWARAKWRTCDELVTAMIQRIATIAIGSKDDNQESANERFTKIEEEFDKALYKNATHIYIRYCLIGTLPTENTYVYKISKETMGHLMYYLRLIRMGSLSGHVSSQLFNQELKRLSNAEFLSASYIQKADVDFDIIKKMPQLWSRIYVKKGIVWQPHSNMVLALIKFYSYKAFQEGPEADISFTYLVRVRMAIFKSRLDHHEKIRIRYNMLGEFPMEDGRYIEVSDKQLIEVMPHGYLMALRALATGGFNSFEKKALGTAPEIIARMQWNFISLLKKGNYTIHHLYRLPLLWYQARWRPSEILVLAILKAYKNSNDDFARTLIKKITEALTHYSKEEYHLKYAFIGFFPENNDYYFVLPTEKLRNVLSNTTIPDKA